MTLDHHPLALATATSLHSADRHKTTPPAPVAPFAWPLAVQHLGIAPGVGPDKHAGPWLLVHEQAHAFHQFQAVLVGRIHRCTCLRSWRRCRTAKCREVPRCRQYEAYSAGCARALPVGHAAGRVRALPQAATAAQTLPESCESRPCAPLPAAFRLRSACWRAGWRA